jgi:23S rRNA (pseudouridine1915-N3)-methyltransferase
MKARLLAVGSGMPGWVNEGYAEYAKRLSHWLPLELIEIAPGLRGKSRDSERARAEEGQRLLAAIPRGSHVIALEVSGRALTSEGLAERLQHWRMQGQDLVLLIGGPEGFDPAVLARADERWSLGPLTLPHPLVRVVVAEQLYRAASQLANHPYHRGG